MVLRGLGTQMLMKIHNKYLAKKTDLPTKSDESLWQLDWWQICWIGRDLANTIIVFFAPLKTNKFPRKSMVGKWVISFWNGPFLGDIP